jgi:CheY-like chemotaxis protein
MSNDYTYLTISSQTIGHQTNSRKIFNILIVDDDVNVAENFKILLSCRGHNVMTVHDGIRCISKCTDNDIHFDIIFLDYHMSDLDGIQVAEIVKDNGKKTIIFAYTGDNSEKTLCEFKMAGMDGVIVKPMDISGLEMLMNKLENTNSLNKESISILSKKSGKSILIFDEIKLF